LHKTSEAAKRQFKRNASQHACKKQTTQFWAPDVARAAVKYTFVYGFATVTEVEGF
jgi:hypothetical protein